MLQQTFEKDLGISDEPGIRECKIPRCPPLDGIVKENDTLRL
jgi:hypothetical protein